MSENVSFTGTAEKPPKRRLSKSFIKMLARTKSHLEAKLGVGVHVQSTQSLKAADTASLNSNSTTLIDLGDSKPPRRFKIYSITRVESISNSNKNGGNASPRLTHLSHSSSANQLFQNTLQIARSNNSLNKSKDSFAPQPPPPPPFVRDYLEATSKPTPASPKITAANDNPVLMSRGGAAPNYEDIHNTNSPHIHARRDEDVRVPNKKQQQQYEQQKMSHEEIHRHERRDKERKARKEKRADEVTENAYKIVNSYQSKALNTTDHPSEEEASAVNSVAPSRFRYHEPFEAAGAETTSSQTPPQPKPRKNLPPPTCSDPSPGGARKKMIPFYNDRDYDAQIIDRHIRNHKSEAERKSTHLHHHRRDDEYTVDEEVKQQIERTNEFLRAAARRERDQTENNSQRISLSNNEQDFKSFSNNRNIIIIEKPAATGSLQHRHHNRPLTQGLFASVRGSGGNENDFMSSASAFNFTLV